MTVRRTASFPHIGGPYDGVSLLVEVDANGEPVELNLITDITSPNPTRNASSETVVDQMEIMYEREDRLGDEGLVYVFVYRGTTVLDKAA